MTGSGDVRKYFDIVKASAEKLRAGGVEVYVFKCPFCGRAILGKTPNELLLNSSRHLSKCVAKREGLQVEV